MRATDSHSISNASASSDPFYVYGGHYQFTAVATWGGGTVKLQQLGPDGSTYLDTGLSLTANGIDQDILAPGTYKINVATATGVYANLTRVPWD
jgi:hypothetical protein